VLISRLLGLGLTTALAIGAFACGGDEVVIDIGPVPPPSSLTVDEDPSTSTTGNVEERRTTSSSARPPLTTSTSVPARAPTPSTSPTSVRPRVGERRPLPDKSDARRGPGESDGDGVPSGLSIVLTLDRFEVNDRQDGLFGADEVSLLVIPIGGGAPPARHVDLGEIEPGVGHELGRDLVRYVDPVGTISVQVVAVERDSDGFAELFAAVLGGVDRVVTGTTGFDLLDSESLGRSQAEVVELTLAELTADGGPLVNDHDLLGICWFSLDLDVEPPEGAVTTVVDCGGRVDGPTSQLRFSGERGRWAADLHWESSER